MRIELEKNWREPLRLAEVFKSRICRTSSVAKSITGIATHSGEVQQGDLFLAFRGKENNGTAYIEDALRAGAIAIMTEDGGEDYPGDFWHFHVSSIENALMEAAATKRAESKSTVIAVTGSAGKTTTKEALSVILGAVHNEGNYNSTIGMPLSVLSMREAAHWVCELGINHVGEMERMAVALRPDIALITNVGTAHIGKMGDYATLLAEKLKVSKGIAEGGILLIPHTLKKTLLHAPLCHLFCFGAGDEADFWTENISMGEWGVRCDLHSRDRVITNLAWRVPGQIGLSLIAQVGAVGILCGRSDAQIREGLCAAAKATPRFRVLAVKEFLFVEDAYNASPEAMIASLEALRHIGGQRPLAAVLGDMLELGEHSKALHAAVGAAAASTGLSRLFTYGEAALEIARTASEYGMTDTNIFSFTESQAPALCAAIRQYLPPRAAVLFKASHKMRLDDLAKEVEMGI